MDLKAETNIVHRVMASERGRTHVKLQKESMALKLGRTQPINHLMSEEAPAVITVQSKQHQSSNWAGFQSTSVLLQDEEASLRRLK